TPSFFTLSCLNPLLAMLLTGLSPRQLIDMYGFFGNLGVATKEIDEILNFVVKIRCDLAHGNVSFCDASSPILWSKLVDDKDKLVKYLTHMLNNIDNYIEKKKYRI
ncbi:MAE_28990/MAE_18760 family HEPN-like nuclease, partial [Microcoleus sp. MON1_C5]|uniref:MAE_28990/MAE_18760 family HEPN-like nuclease n=1 Tax=Microcoleus sp. MON1_C5 TaxID=2818828 RepID=UPI002FD56291